MARPIRIEQAAGITSPPGAMNAGRFSATTIGLNEYAAVGMTVTRYRKRLQHDRSEQKQIRQISKMLNVEM